MPPRARSARRRVSGRMRHFRRSRPSPDAARQMSPPAPTPLPGNASMARTHVPPPRAPPPTDAPDPASPAPFVQRFPRVSSTTHAGPSVGLPVYDAHTRSMPLYAKDERGSLDGAFGGRCAPRALPNDILPSAQPPLVPARGEPEGARALFADGAALRPPVWRRHYASSDRGAGCRDGRADPAWWAYSGGGCG